MSQTKAGAAKARQKMIERYGSEEAYKEDMRNRARKGGSNGSTCGIVSSMSVLKPIVNNPEYKVLNTGVILSKSGQPMKPQVDSKGYLRIQIKTPEKTNGVTTLKLHRVVAEAFIPNPDNLPQVDHLDGDKSNNNVSNLEWVSNTENMKRAVDRGVFLARKPKEIDMYASSALGAILDGYLAKDVLNSFNMNVKTFWKWVDKDNIKPTIYQVNPEWRKRKYYYFDKKRNKWRVERSDFKPGKQFVTEEEAIEYANQPIAGGFASTVVGKDGLNGYQRARVAGAVGGTKSRRNKKH